ncbi:MAG: FAD:protein FMN transferase [Planctomycetota bacterium]
MRATNHAIVRRAAFAMGTRFEVALSGDPGDGLEPLADLLLEEIEEWDRQLSVFRPDSLVSFINRHASTRPVRVGRDLFALLLRCLEVFEASNGAFDVTVAPLMRHFGFHQYADSARDDGPPVFGSDALVLDPEDESVAFSRPGLALDLGGVGKGFVLDRIAEILDQERGLWRAAFVHGGTSSVLARGEPPDGRPFRIQVRKPAAPHPDPSPLIITLRDEALSVSASHGRVVESAGETLCHVINPATARPVAGGPDLVAVVADSALLADAWSTAILSSGRRPDALDPGLTSVTIPTSTYRERQVT